MMFKKSGYDLISDPSSETEKKSKSMLMNLRETPFILASFVDS